MYSLTNITLGELSHRDLRMASRSFQHSKVVIIVRTRGETKETKKSRSPILPIATAPSGTPPPTQSSGEPLFHTLPNTTQESTISTDETIAPALAEGGPPCSGEAFS
jgi:hypothetical protein